MTNPQRYLRLILGSVGNAYSLMILNWLRTGKAPKAAQWALLAGGIETAAQWADLIAMADLVYRATGEKIKLPPPAKGQPPAIQMVLFANPHAKAHAKQTHPIAAWRAKMWAKAEREYGEKLAERRELLKNQQPLTAKHIDYRMRRMYREQIGEIASIGAEVALAVPEIGAMFPFKGYRSREDWRVRPTHAACNGMIAQRTWDGWRYATPLAGWNCRCLVRHYAIHECKRHGWLDENDKPRFLVKWPSAKAKQYWENGLPYHDNPDPHAVPKELRNPLSVFPDPGIWMMPRPVSFDLGPAEVPGAKRASHPQP